MQVNNRLFEIVYIDAKEIEETWQKLFTGLYEKIPNKVNHKTIELYTKYEGDYAKPYTFIAGLEVSKKAENSNKIESVIIPKGK